jgi:hypothetical protein
MVHDSFQPKSHNNKQKKKHYCNYKIDCKHTEGILFHQQQRDTKIEETDHLTIPTTPGGAPILRILILVVGNNPRLVVVANKHHSLFPL